MNCDICDRTERRICSRTGAVVITVTWSVRIDGRIVHSLHGPTARAGCERLVEHLRARAAAGSTAIVPARLPRTRADGWQPRDGEA